jgi:hypothetical protein
MSGWNTIRLVKTIEEEIDQLGLKFAKTKHGDWGQTERSLSLVPKDTDSLPIYSRDAELYVGSLEALETWLMGVRWAREYDRMLKLSNDEKRAKAEKNERNCQLMNTIKKSKLVSGEVK